MDINEILKSLERLEINLQNIDSARTQVEKTIAAYDGAKEQLSQVGSEISSISDELKVIFTTIENNQNVLSSQIDDNVKILFNKAETSLDGLKTSTEALQTSFENSCREAIESFTSALNQGSASIKSSAEDSIKILSDGTSKSLAYVTEALTELKGITDDIHLELKESCGRIIANHKEEVSKISIAFQTSTSQSIKRAEDIFHGVVVSLSKYKILIEETVHNIKAEIGTLKSYLDNIQQSISAMDIKLCEIVRAIDNKSDSMQSSIKEVKDMLPPIIGSLNNINGQATANKDGIKQIETKIENGLNLVIRSNSSNFSTLTDRISQLEASLARNKKISMYGFIAVIICICLLVITLIKVFA